MTHEFDSHFCLTYHYIKKFKLKYKLFNFGGEMRYILIAIFTISLYAQQYIPNVLLIKIERGFLSQLNEQNFNTGLTGITAIDSLNVHYHAHYIKRMFPTFKYKGSPQRPVTLDQWLHIEFKEPQDIPALVSLYQQLTEVQVAEPSVIVELERTPNDPNVGSQWHIEQSNDHDVDAYAAWDIATGDSNIIVGVLDTGVRYFHQDLGGANASYANPENSRGNMWINWAEKFGTPGVDDDGNGKIDDWIGWDFVTGNPNIFNLGDDYDVEDNDPRDYNGHGTHCAGNVAAINNNNLGVCAVSGGWGEDSNARGNGAEIMALRIGWDDLPSGRVSMEFAANAFTYAADNGAKITSCSWGSTQTTSLEDAVNYFLYNTTTNLGPANRVRLIFKSAGNDDADQTDYLTSRNDVTAVAATDENDSKASFSNYGTWVDISAPGNNIYSTYHDSNSPETDAYASLSGTSMATPIAASVAALIWSHNPNLTAPQVEQMLFDSADDLDALNPSYVGKLGAGRVNAGTAAQLADQSLPVSLLSFQAQRTRQGIQLSWQTASEINNIGFNIYRAQNIAREFKLIASYKTNPNLHGLGNSSIGRTYTFTDSSNLEAGKTYFYLLEDVATNGNTEKHGPVSVNIPAELVPATLTLLQNYPNPFNQQTKIRFYLPSRFKNQKLTISIFTLNGKRIKQLTRAVFTAGWHEIVWDGKNEHNQSVSSGLYFYGIESENFRKFRKLLLVR